MHKPLTRTDTAWFRMDTPQNLMVVSGLFRFDAPADIARLKAVLSDGFLKYDRFRQRVERRGKKLWWVDDPDFHVDRHVLGEELPGAGDEAALRGVIEEQLKTPLDPALPLWQLRLYHGQASGSTLLFRIHHCIADGIALLQVLLDSCEHVGGAEREAPRAQPKRPWYWWALLPLSATLWTLRYLWVSNWLVMRPKDPPTIYKGALTGVKRIAWTSPLPLQDVKATAARAGCKINDLLMAVAAGAMRRYAETRGAALDGLGVRVMVPVNLRSAKAAKELGNAFAVVSPTLPVGSADPDERLRLVKQRMDRIKRSPEPFSAAMLVRVLGSVGVGLQHRIQRYLVDKATLTITNVPGPRKKLALGGVPVGKVLFWVPMFGPTGLGFSVFTYADELLIGAISDEALVPDPQALADAFVAELESLHERHGGARPRPAEPAPSVEHAA